MAERVKSMRGVRIGGLLLGLGETESGDVFFIMNNEGEGAGAAAAAINEQKKIREGGLPDTQGKIDRQYETEANNRGFFGIFKL